MAANAELSTKEMIVKAATEMFAGRGFDQTKISDISASVGISDRTIYEHYKSKEDILLTIVKERTQHLIRANELHLRGLTGAQVKLRKLIWNYMEFLSSDREYACLVLFELRSQRSFYEENIFPQVRALTKMFGDVLREGQKTGDFLPWVPPSLMLNMIFGTIDHILLTWLAVNNPQDPMESFENLFDILTHAIRTREMRQAPVDKRRQILDAASVEFAKTGYAKARIQDIAKLAGVADGTIYLYFKNKEELLFELPVENTKELISILEELLSGAKRTDLKLSVLLTEYLKYLDSRKDYSSVVLLGLRYNRNFYKTGGYELFRRFGMLFYQTILEGQEQGCFRAECDPYILVKMIFGVIDHSMLSSMMFGKPTCILALTNTISTLILNALME